MYHLELRRFPRRVHRFNLTGPQVGAIVLPWVQERVVELGEQRWSPHEASITIIEGPKLPAERLALGRGWREAERDGTDVTQQVLAEARRAVASGHGATADAVGVGSTHADTAGTPDTPAAPEADPLAAGVELAALLGPDPLGLLASWRAVAARSGGLTPSESLAVAERELARQRSGGK